MPVTVTAIAPWMFRPTDHAAAAAAPDAVRPAADEMRDGVARAHFEHIVALELRQRPRRVVHCERVVEAARLAVQRAPPAVRLPVQRAPPAVPRERAGGERGPRA